MSSQAKATRPSGKQSRLNRVETKRIIAEVDAAVAAGRGEIAFPRKGRPSLTGHHEVSPSVGFRVTPDLRNRAHAVANARGMTVSALARQALEDFLRKAG